MRVRAWVGVATVGFLSVQPLGAADRTVSIPITVTDGQAPVTGLSAADFTIFEDGQPQTIQSFGTGSIPLSLAIVVDTSPRVRGPWVNDAFSAVRQLIEDTLAPEDEAALYVFAKGPMQLQPWAQRGTLLDSRYQIPSALGSPLFTTISRAVKDTDRAKHARRVLLVVTGGIATDGWSRKSGPSFEAPLGTNLSTPSTAMPTNEGWTPSIEREQALKDLRSRGVLFYAVASDGPPTPQTGADPVPAVNVKDLSAVSDETGGLTEKVTSMDALPRAIARVGDELKHQYLITFTSTRAQDGQFHEIRVEPKNAEHKVRAPRGYRGKK
jgi:VWFA-related protein